MFTQYFFIGNVSKLRIFNNLFTQSQRELWACAHNSHLLYQSIYMHLLYSIFHLLIMDKWLTNLNI